MNGIGRGDKNQNRENPAILTRETVGMTLLLFGVVSLFIIITGPIVFGEIGVAITAFYLGLLGFYVYPVLLSVIALSLGLVAGKQLIPAPWIARGMLFLLAVFLIVHTATAEKFFLVDSAVQSYGVYLGGCWTAASASAANATGGGVVFGLIAYPVRLLLTAAGAYVLYAFLTLGAGYLVFRLTPLFGKTAARTPRPRKAPQRPEKKPQSIAFEDLPSERTHAQDPRRTEPAPRPASPSAASYDFRDPAPRYPMNAAPAQGRSPYPNAASPYASAPRTSRPAPQSDRGAPAPRTSQPAPEPYDPVKHSREFLFGNNAAEDYRHNLIFDSNSSFNTRPRGSTVYPADRSAMNTPFYTGEESKREDPTPAPGYGDAFAADAEKDRPALPRRVTAAPREYPEPDLNYPQPSYQAPAQPTAPRDFYAHDVPTDFSSAPNVYEGDEPTMSEDRRTDPSRDLFRTDDALSRGEDDFSCTNDDLADRGRDFDRGRDIPPADTSREASARSMPPAAPSFRDAGRIEDPADRRTFETPMDDRSFGRIEDPADRQAAREASEPPAPETDMGPEPDIEEEYARGTDSDLFDGDGGDFRMPESRDFGRDGDRTPSRSERGLGGISRSRGESLDRASFDDSRSREPAEEQPALPSRDVRPEPSEPPKPKKHVWKKYHRPNLALLRQYDDRSSVAQEEIERNSEIIIDVLRNFKIDAEVIKVTCGSAVTRYDFDIPRNITVPQVLKHERELAMRLNADEGVHMYANNKTGAISIEVPNAKRATVGLRSVLFAEDYVRAQPGSLVFGIGQDIEGNSICGNIVKMKHLLVAGSTGSGKSVCLNAMLISLVAKYSPEDLRLILIDPKKVEFAIYEGLPHLMINEIINEPNKAIAALNWAIKEMDRRYTVFEQKTKSGINVQNIDDYNANLTEDEQKLPKLVIVFDELADFMMIAKKDIEERIQRLTQKARAAGIHLVIATQRPSVDVITGVIKGNLPTRIAFRTIQQTDSRTILDESGAENLLGLGDLLFTTEGMRGTMRVQGAFISAGEVQAILQDIKTNNESFFDDEVSAYINKGDTSDGSANPAEFAGDGDGNVSKVYIDALGIVIKRGQASISQIQRSCGVGYNHAGKIIEWMEAMGYISAFDGAKARAVLITKEEYEAKYGRLD